jgi:hypothetical protein
MPSMAENVRCLRSSSTSKMQEVNASTMDLVRRLSAVDPRLYCRRGHDEDSPEQTMSNHPSQRCLVQPMIFSGAQLQASMPRIGSSVSPAETLHMPKCGVQTIGHCWLECTCVLVPDSVASIEACEIRRPGGWMDVCMNCKIHMLNQDAPNLRRCPASLQPEKSMQ